MITRIREVRRAKGLTLLDVATRCVPPTTAQTIGRLETGTRTVSVGWLNRIAKALGVTAADLVELPHRADLPVVALLARDGAHAPGREMIVPPPEPSPGMVALQVQESVGDYRAGDIVWCERLAPDGFGAARNRDIVAPRPAGRFAFGRLIDLQPGRLLLLPPSGGARQTVISDPPWIAVARTLVRAI